VPKKYELTTCKLYSNKYMVRCIHKLQHNMFLIFTFYGCVTWFLALTGEKQLKNWILRKNLDLTDST